jgi:hypothetical protein
MIGDNGGNTLHGTCRIGLAFVWARVEGIRVTDVLWIHKASTPQFAMTVIVGVVAILGEVSLPVAKLAYIVLGADIPSQSMA